MRKLFWCSTILTVVTATFTYWTGVYAGRHPESLLGMCTGIVYDGRGCSCSCSAWDSASEDSELSAPEEPQAVPVTLPDQPEPIVLDQDLRKAESEWSAQWLNSSKPGLSPASAADAEVGCPVMPPCADETNLPSLMPYATDEDAANPGKTAWSGPFFDEQCTGANEEADTILQDQEPLPPCPKCQKTKCCPAQPPKSAPLPAGAQEEQEHGAPDKDTAGSVRPNQRPKPSTELLRRQPSQEGAMAPKVDTTEFRPSDARRGEFDKVPF
jgi:hypothetical protein